MAVEEGQDVPGGVGASDEPRPDQPFPLLGPDESNSLQTADVLRELGLEIACNSRHRNERQPKAPPPPPSRIDTGAALRGAFKKSPAAARGR